MTQLSDYDYGLSDSDEVELRQLEANNNTLKRKSEEELSKEIKRARVDESESPALKIAKDILQQHFRLNAFRLKQLEAIGRLLSGESAVVVFPTGTTTQCFHYVVTDR